MWINIFFNTPSNFRTMILLDYIFAGGGSYYSSKQNSSYYSFRGIIFSKIVEKERKGARRTSGGGGDKPALNMHLNRLNLDIIFGKRTKKKSKRI